MTKEEASQLVRMKDDDEAPLLMKVQEVLPNTMLVYANKGEEAMLLRKAKAAQQER